jgi:hypothetical protein
VNRLAPAVLALTIGACLPGTQARTYPRWVLVGGRDLRHGCAIADAFVRRSGKEGVGVTVALRSTRDCDVRITRAALVFPDDVAAAGVVPAAAPMAGRSLAYAWIPIRFDGDRAWNQHRDRAALELELTVDGVARAWKIPAEQRP